MQSKRLVRQGLLIAAFAFAHYAVWVGAVMISFGSGMARFDTGADETLQEHFATRLADALGFPGGNITEHFGLVYLGKWAELILFLNSVLWALCLYAFVFGVMFLLRRQRPCVETRG